MEEGGGGCEVSMRSVRAAISLLYLLSFRPSFRLASGFVERGVSVTVRFVRVCESAVKVGVSSAVVLLSILPWVMLTSMTKLHDPAASARYLTIRGLLA